jgi:hypothetical protein
MDGGGIAMVGDRIVTAWRRDGEIFLASPGQKEVSLGKGVDVSIASGNQGGVYAVWSAQSGIVAAAPGKTAPVTIAPKGAFPNVVRLSNGHALAAWENGGGISFRTIE